MPFANRTCVERRCGHCGCDCGLQFWPADNRSVVYLLHICCARGPTMPGFDGARFSWSALRAYLCATPTRPGRVTHSFSGKTCLISPLPPKVVPLVGHAARCLARERQVFPHRNQVRCGWRSARYESKVQCDRALSFTCALAGSQVMRGDMPCHRVECEIQWCDGTGLCRLGAVAVEHYSRDGFHFERSVPRHRNQCLTYHSRAQEWS